MNFIAPSDQHFCIKRKLPAANPFPNPIGPSCTAPAAGAAKSATVPPRNPFATDFAPDARPALKSLGLKQWHQIHICKPVCTPGQAALLNTACVQEISGR
jgi:hypothetical protein